MKQYSSIGHEHVSGKSYYVYDKLDGSNMRVEWTKKKGFVKFGSRTQLVDANTGPLGAFSIPLMQAQEELISGALGPLQVQEATCFFEFFGPQSFAGVHQWEQDRDKFKVVLFDVTLFKKGFMMPKEFQKTFEGIVPLPNLLHIGNVTEDLVRQIKDGTLEGITEEGVVCKSSPLKNGYPPYCFKIKTEKWINRVKALYTDPKVLKELL
jgi:hypothetical protein